MLEIDIIFFFLYPETKRSNCYFFMHTVSSSWESGINLLWYKDLFKRLTSFRMYSSIHNNINLLITQKIIATYVLRKKNVNFYFMCTDWDTSTTIALESWEKKAMASCIKNGSLHLGSPLFSLPCSLAFSFFFDSLCL